MGDFDNSTMRQGQQEGDLFSVSRSNPSLTLRCKIVLLGDTTVGKTSIANVFKGGVGSTDKNYKMTMGVEFVVKRVNIPETNVYVEMYIVDCGGFSLCQELLKPHWDNANAVMLVYDVSNPESFRSLANWYEQIKTSRMESAITGVVVASKTDLAGVPGAVPSLSGKAFASELGLEFFEACATEGNVDAPFHFLAEVFWQKYCERKEQLDNLH
eukprot:gnl/TRDRNA2_/TRDRNA2_180965_c0_seq1.p1 gnl/TRDRNA2_/TRDRNA2_180965_c0~~gnl/TRDRNA2_/TRDRNA2_180965_c0_seq1.p1  ORF type:complete len:240 (+),score=49.72 gnl/TRDRNA2_/TRDRNA2_180965_c0_seq1:82-720(+)